MKNKKKSSGELDLDQLSEEFEEASIDKSDLFDFYHDNWDRLIAEIRMLRERAK